MPVTDVRSDLEAHTITITAQFAAPVQRVWDLYADPRLLEQVWGPPTYPATFVQHALAPGARTTYYMSGPNGEKFCGYWQITGVDAPHRFTFDDGFADEDFTANPDLPVSGNEFTFTCDEAGTTATYVSTYADAASLQQVLDMGALEGARSAIDQIDGVLGD